MAVACRELAPEYELEHQVAESGVAIVFPQPVFERDLTHRIFFSILCDSSGFIYPSSSAAPHLCRA